MRAPPHSERPHNRVLPTTHTHWSLLLGWFFQFENNLNFSIYLSQLNFVFFKTLTSWRSIQWRSLLVLCEKTTLILWHGPYTIVLLLSASWFTELCLTPAQPPPGVLSDHSLGACQLHLCASCPTQSEKPFRLNALAKAMTVLKVSLDVTV